jgi:hypothetical protein
MDRGLEARWCLLLRGVKKVVRKKGKGEEKECLAYVHMVRGVV